MEKVEATKFNFKDTIKILKKRKREEGRLIYDQRNVELLVHATQIAPACEIYPHPDISSIFAEEFGMMAVEGDCVASWASAEAKGLKMKVGIGFAAGTIIGVYGGRKTDSKGMYVLDVTVAGEKRSWVDGDPAHGSCSIFGRMNEDIHNKKMNCEMDVAGIIYTTARTVGSEELLTSYGEMYNWSHVVQIGSDQTWSILGSAVHVFKLISLRRLKNLGRVIPFISG